MAELMTASNQGYYPDETDRRQTHVDAVLAERDEITAALTQAVSQLENRLAPVLIDEMSQPEPNQTSPMPSPMRVPLASAIHEGNAQTRRAILRIASVLDRLEL